MRPLRIGLAMLLLALPLTIVACAQAAGDDDGAAEPSLRTLSEADAVGELAERDGDVEIIDVRTPAEHARGALDGATLIDIQSPDFRERVDELDRDGSYFLYCRSGNRSGQAAQIMADMGFTDLTNIGGYEALAASGAATDR